MFRIFRVIFFLSFLTFIPIFVCGSCSHVVVVVVVVVHLHLGQSVFCRPYGWLGQVCFSFESIYWVARGIHGMHLGSIGVCFLTEALDVALSRCFAVYSSVWLLRPMSLRMGTSGRDGTGDWGDGESRLGSGLPVGPEEGNPA